MPESKGPGQDKPTAEVINLGEVIRDKSNNEQDLAVAGNGPLYFSPQKVETTLDHAILEAGVISRHLSEADNLYKDFVSRLNAVTEARNRPEAEMRKEMQVELSMCQSLVKSFRTEDLVMVIDEHLKNPRKMHGTNMSAVSAELLSRFPNK